MILCDIIILYVILTKFENTMQYKIFYVSKMLRLFLVKIFTDY